LDAEAAETRAAKAEAEAKRLQDEVHSRDAEILNVRNKVTLLQDELTRAERRVEEVSQQRDKSYNEASVVDTLTKKLQMVEQQSDEKDAKLKDAIDK
jgi:predicted RNase H-like nuclease (RuvC/YqgF family)